MTMDGRARWLALIIVCLGDLMIVLDVTIVNVALPSIQEDLGFTETSLAWVVNAYLLDVRRLPPARWQARRPVRAPAAVSRGHRAVHARLARVRPRDSHRSADRRARRAGPRRRSRLSCRALADHDALRRARRAREGDGRLRLRRLRRRQPRRAARWDLTDALNWHWIFLVNMPIGVARRSRSRCALLPSERHPGRRGGWMSPAPSPSRHR